MTTESTNWPAALSVGDHISIDLLRDGDRLLGIGAVRYDATLLRTGAVPWRPVIGTADGVQYPELRLRAVEPTDDGGVRLVCDALGFRTRLHDQLDEYLCEIVDLTPDTPICDTVEWLFQRSEVALGGHRLTGFSYQIRWQSSDPARQCHRIHDLATWEIGGEVAGNTLLLQGQLNPPATALERSGYFTTACNYYGAEMRGRLGPGDRISMQRLPRIGTLQAFDMLHHASGVLLGVFEDVEEVVSLVQKDEGDDFLHVLDEHRAPLSAEMATAPKHMLFLPTTGAQPRATYRDLWWATNEHVHSQARTRAGVQRSSVLPRVWTPQMAADPLAIRGTPVSRDAHLYHLADHVLEDWQDMGVREICMPSLWKSDFTEMRHVCKNDTGMHGGFTVSGICCVHDHVVSPQYGGAEAVRYFTDRAHALGMRVQMWWATHLSRRAPVFAEHPDWMIRSRDDQPGTAGIGNQVCIPMDLNNPACFEWELARLRALHTATGIDGFFHDSYGNYTFLPLNFADNRRGQQTSYGRLIHELQALGMTCFTAEGLGPWAVGHFGMQLLLSEDGAAGNYQNALEWWLGDEDMVCGLNMGIHAEHWSGRDEAARDFAFRCLAGGGRFGFSETRGAIEVWDGWWREMNRLHARLGAVTGRRELLPDDQGVRWHRDDSADLLFAFAAFDVDSAEEPVTRITGDGPVALEPSPGLTTEPYAVYTLG
jgi:hypothetical protein